jgi:hypothetical protein
MHLAALAATPLDLRLGVCNTVGLILESGKLLLEAFDSQFAAFDG